MAATVEELEALEQAIRSGVLSSRYQDSQGLSRSFQYNTLDELLRAREILRRDLGLDPSKGRRIRVWKASRGLR